MTMNTAPVVFVIDDDSSVREALRKLITSVGLRVETFGSAREFLIDKRPFVRFHAAQSLVTFAGLHIIRIVLSAVFGIGWWYYGGWANLGMGALLIGGVGLISVVLWIVCMVKAYQGERFKLPISGDIAEGIAGR